jgi:hypothetical protein
MKRINQILNYPSVAYEDISHFFDHAIAELNTILKVAIPSVSEMISNNTLDTSLQENTVLLTAVPTGANSIPAVNVVPTTYPATKVVEGVTSEVVSDYVYYTSTDSAFDRAFYVWNGFTWNHHANLYGVVFDGTSKRTYVTVAVGSKAWWTETPVQRTLDFDLCEYLTMDWWTLFIVPYVCFKFAVRNGDGGELYQAEFTQGLQQLQTSYDVPNFVTLQEVAGNPIYTEIVKNNLANLNQKTPVRAITDHMRVGNAIGAVFENSVIGGWGL